MAETTSSTWLQTLAAHRHEVPQFYPPLLSANDKYSSPPWPQNMNLNMNQLKNEDDDEIHNDWKDWKNAQLQSPFFHSLPPEIRLDIYELYWGRGRHIVAVKPRAGSDGYTAPKRRVLVGLSCLVDLDLNNDSNEGAKRNMNVNTNINMGDDNWGYPGHGNLRWNSGAARGEESSWGNHQQCEDAFLQTRLCRPEDEKTPDHVPSILLVCKRMNYEAEKQLWKRTTFHFHHFETAFRFLVLQPPSPRVLQLCSLHLVFSYWRIFHCALPRYGPQWISTYTSDDDEKKTEKNSWEWLFIRLKQFPALRELRLHLDYQPGYHHRYSKEEHLHRLWEQEQDMLSQLREWEPGVVTVSIPSHTNTTGREFAGLEGVRVVRRAGPSPSV